MYNHDTKGGVISAARIRVRPDKRKELVMTLNSLIDQIQSEKGCKRYRYFGEDSEKNAFMLIGEWETRSDWDRHLRSENFTILKGTLLILGNEKGLDFRLLTRVGVNEALVPDSKINSGIRH